MKRLAKTRQARAPRALARDPHPSRWPQPVARFAGFHGYGGVCKNSNDVS